MFEIPLFPLNTVLFPGMPLPLHIFEDRYKQMVADCVEEQQPFGVVLIREGVAEHGPLAEPHSVGCTAQITHVQPLDDGRMYIMSVGKERFRINSLRYDKPYLVGEVETLPLNEESAGRLDVASQQLRPLVVDYLEILSRLGQGDIDTTQIPFDTESLVYLAASIIQLPQEEKQDFLAAAGTSHLLNRLRSAYRHELSLLRLMPKEENTAFSLN